MDTRKDTVYGFHPNNNTNWNDPLRFNTIVIKYNSDRQGIKVIMNHIKKQSDHLSFIIV